MSALLAALRISRRDAWRAKGRSALIVAMVGLPVLVITALLTALSTVDISPQEGLTATLGTADALVRDLGRQPVRDQDYAARSYSSGGGEDVRPWTTREITSVLPPGSRAQQLHSRYEPYRLARWWPAVEIMETDLRDPLTRGMFQVVRGRPPAAPDEVAVSPPLVGQGAKIGGTISLTREGTVKKVVGVVERAPWASVEFVVAFPGGGLADQRYQRTWLVDTPAPVTWSGVRKLNTLGLAVASRAVIENPGSAPDDVWAGTEDVDSEFWPALIAMITLMVILEVVLLAGPAFAVGLRRRRTELGLVAAQGGSARHLRMIVLMDGVVLGALSAVLGAALGIPLARALPAMVDRGPGGGGWPFEVPWAQVAAVVVLGAASAVVAAVVPASQAVRMSVSAVLGGRAAAPRPRRGWPVAGAVLAVAGVGLTVAGAWLGILAIVGGTLITQLGFVALVPRLVGLLGRLSGRLPLPLRLASRDAVRHGGRTAPAVAAVMAGVAVAVALAIPLNSASIQEKINYQPRQAVGAFEVEGTRLTPEEWQPVRELLRRELPGVTPVELRGHRRGSSGMFMRLVAGNCGAPCVITDRDFPVGDERVLRYVLGREDPAAEAALRAGKMVVLDPRGINGGQARVETTTYRGESESRQTATVPAVAAEPAERRSVRAVIPPGLAEKLGMRVEVAMLVVDPREHRVTDAERERIDARLPEVVVHAGTYLERGFTRDSVFELVLLGGAVGLLVLVAAFTATGLAAADARADLAGLAAIGAPAGVRRLFVAGQAGFITASGAVLGVLSGAVPGLVSAWPAGTSSGGAITSNPSPLGYVSDVLSDNTVLDVPWSLLAILVIGLPVLAALVAGAFTRTRVTPTRRTG
ncbi:FtsX-like permease family protein [Streptosporangium roseum]|uniref:FtsX-like permease family protein n=1 Tax=Streptosporangium roseum TaxID=2001 RepID=UPI00331823DA